MQKDDSLGQLTKHCHFKALKSAKEAIKKTPIPTEVLMFIFWLSTNSRIHTAATPAYLTLQLLLAATQDSHCTEQRQNSTANIRVKETILTIFPTVFFYICHLFPQTMVGRRQTQCHVWQIQSWKKQKEHTL